MPLGREGCLEGVRVRGGGTEGGQTATATMLVSNWLGWGLVHSRREGH